MTSRIVLVEPQAPSVEDATYQAIAGALLGGAIADALGWPTEFAKKPEDLREFGVEYPVRGPAPWHKRAGGRFFTRIDYVQPGEYSDDTQLALSLIRSLRADGSVDNDYFAKTELAYWLDYARGAGATVTAAARAASRKRADWRWNYFRSTRGRNEFDYRDAGANGAAMRVGPIALANHLDAQRAYLECWKNAIVTHGHPRAILGAAIFCEALRRVVSREQTNGEALLAELSAFAAAASPPVADSDVSYWLGQWEETGRNFEQLWRATQSEIVDLLSTALHSRTRELRDLYRDLGCLTPATKGSGTGTVVAALAVFARFGSAYGRTALMAVNELGSDTDTIGAMAGSLAGAALGYTAIPEEWATLLADYGYFAKAGQLLTEISLRRATTNWLRLRPYDSTGRRADENILVQIKTQRVRERRRVWHPMLGEGIVLKAESQRVETRGRVLLATVKFDVGVTCKFHSYVSGRTPEPEADTERQTESGDEAAIRDAFMRHLSASGWSVSYERAADVMATRDGDTLVAEVKSDTGPNAGLDIDTAYGQLLRRMTRGAARFALVIPRRVLALAVRVPKPIRDRLGISIFTVDDQMAVVEQSD